MQFRLLHRKSFLMVMVLLPALLGLPFFTTAGQAQQAVVFESVLVNIWPEYDQPSVLVIYHLSIASQVSLPAEVSIRIPAAAGQPHAVAMEDAAGPLNLGYEITPAGDWLEVTFTAPSPEVRVEFYDPDLNLNDNQRAYTYRWPGDYTVNNLTVQVQQPARATDMSFLPAMGSGRVAQDGLTYYTLLAGTVQSGTEFELQIRYNKPDNTLTDADSFQPVQPVEPLGNTTSGRVTFDEVLPWALGILGLLLIGIGVWWYLRTGQPAPQQSSRRHRPSGAAQAAADSGPSYCHQCGKRAASGDLFCRTCGTKLR